MLFFSLVPHAKVERGSRKDPGFCDAQTEADDEQSGEALSETHEGANDTPDEGESRKPEPRSGEFEDDVGRDFEQYVTNEVDG